jgi:uncharacterized repeat protein (TIGR01451 family)
LAVALIHLCVIVLVACSPAEPPSRVPPYDFARDESVPVLPSDGPIEPVRVELAEVAKLSPIDTGSLRRPGRRLEGPLPEDEILRLQREAEEAPPVDWITRVAAQGPLMPILGVVFESLDFASAGRNFVPPDPELAVGPAHAIAVVNDYFLITDRIGSQLAPPIQFANFFSVLPACSGLFDPNVLYDEQLDRFFLGIDANGTNYCAAMSASSDPTGSWFVYAFGTVPATPPLDFFDFPHAGVGEDAIYMGANIYNNTATTFLRAEVWALDKNAMAAGGSMTVLKQTVTNAFTPQPMNAHGWLQGTWPAGAPHTILANSYLPGSPPVYSGDIFDVWAWSDPFGANAYGLVGSVDLSLATGVAATYPIDAPQLGGNNIQANDWRVLDCEYRNGDVWMTQTISCNPGFGTVDCVRWAEIDPTTPAVRQAGILGTDDIFRIFPDAAVNHCDDMTIGYTRTSMMFFPEVMVTGRLATDPPGSLLPEPPIPLRPGDQPYIPFDPAPHRWGDYTGGTSDPDGVLTWYLGEYSKFIPLPPPPTPTPFAFADWGTFVGEYTTGCDVDLSVSKTNGVTQVTPGNPVTYTITVTNLGRGDAYSAAITDTFPADLTGVTWSCAGQTGPPTSTCHVPSGSGNINITADLQAGSAVTITATGTLSPTASGSLVNTATAAYSGIADPAPGNNSATDTDTIQPVADLSVSKSDGQTSAVPGSPVTYAIAVINNGPSDVVGAQVADVLPVTLSNVVWTCMGQTGPPTSSCTNPSGTGNISELVNIAVGAVVNFTVTGDLSPAATGTLANTVSVSPPAGTVDPVAGNDSATDVDTLTPLADLEVDVTDGSCFVLPGGSTSYTVTVRNLGLSNAPTASVSDTVPGDLTVTSWTCAAAGGAACGGASGTGPLSDGPNLPAGGSVTYTVSATVSGTASGSLTYTVSASPGAGVTDPVPANDSDSDVNALETPVFCDEFEDGTTDAWDRVVT